jgi:uncharacterized oligopeptide transporter (OPT) family protein
MPLLQDAPRTPEELEAARPLDVPPEQVLEMDEATWYEKVYRGEDARQLTVRAVLMGGALGFFLAFTNLYIGLKTGWHLGVAITASILSFSISTGLVRVGAMKSPLSILENNCMQSTASSAGYSTGSTLVSAFPALLLLSVDTEHPLGVHTAWPLVAAWVFFTAVLGVTLAVPMKRSMINQERLRFPSGVAAAVTLQSLYSQGQDALKKARALFAAGGIGLLIPLLKDLEIVKSIEKGKAVRNALVPGSTKIFDWLPGIAVHGKVFALSDFNVKLDNSLALVAAGAMIGLRVTLSMMLGAIVLVWIVSPIALDATWTNALGKVVTAATKPQSAWKEIGLWIGAPMLVSSGLLSFAAQWRTVVRAVSGLYKSSERDDARVTATEVPMRWFAVLGGTSAVAMVLLAWQAFAIPPALGTLAVLMTFFLALVACRATGETDVTPTGAMGKIMQLTYGVLLPQSTTANLMTAAITSGSASASADLLNDLKSGYLLGANPRRQFVAQLSGIFTGTLATVMGYFLLVKDATSLTGTEGHDPAFAAPAAQQWKAVAEVFKVGIANLHPMARTCIGIGVAAGIALTLLERALPKAKRWLPSPTGVGLGFILPFYYPLAMFLGAAIADLAKRLRPEAAERYTVPIASGAIAGESIMGVIVAALNNFVL